MILKTKQDLEPIKERERKATKGPWVRGSLEGSICNEVFRETVRFENGVATPWRGKSEDADFIATSRTDIPNLIETVEALMEENEKIHKLNAELKHKVLGCCND